MINQQRLVINLKDLKEFIAVLEKDSEVKEEVLSKGEGSCIISIIRSHPTNELVYKVLR